MENKYNIENLERFLREKTDEFRMYPSKRVWYSIYNNMHPGNRLPSISMCIILIFSLLIIGFLNTDTSNDYSNNAASIKSVKYATPSIEYKNPFNFYSLSNNKEILHQPYKKIVANSSLDQAYINRTAFVSRTDAIKNNTYSYSYNQKARSYTTTHNKHYTQTNLINIKAENITSTRNNILAAAPIRLPIEKALNVEETDMVLLSRKNANQIINGEHSQAQTPENFEHTSSADKYHTINKTSNLNTKSTDLVLFPRLSKIKAAPPLYSNNNIKNNKIINKALSLSETDKAWIEDFAMYNKQAPKKWQGKIQVQLYITPSVVFRTLKNNAAGNLAFNNTGNINQIDVESIVNHKPSFGIETGLALQYDLFKRLSIKAGVQLNYTRYNIHGFENYHPIATSLTMNRGNGQNGTYELFRTTPFSNSYGLTPVKLHNETYQISVPVGASFKLASINKIDWYVGATIQPTLIAYGKSYLISTDRRNYVQEPTMINRFNLNAGWETYISYKINNYTWQLGPQFRSQIFSTNTKLYSVEEKLQNFGFKIGISKKL